MKLHYTKMNFYKLDESFFNITDGLIPEPFNSLECIKQYNEKWSKVITYLLSDFKNEFFERQNMDDILSSNINFNDSINEVFTIERLDGNGNIVYDFGFDIERAENYIKKVKKDCLKFSLSQFGEVNEKNVVVYQHYSDDTPLKLEPIILGADFVNGRSLFYNIDDNMLDLPLVIDGNKRVSYARSNSYNSILGYHLSLSDMIEGKVLLSRLDEAILSQTADTIKVAKIIKDDTDIDEFKKEFEDFYEKSYLNKYFHDLFS
ncbi:hypothetical protein [Mammaliicoccus sp. J-M41]|uniref:hypothetical protein n=1 Tax=Mammaliicoccus sp. J-M41 TaxID=2898700 RepID=UPI001EFAF1F4|nr:hypothetical protein [Mammaliicoccus sp. J-M41]